MGDSSSSHIWQILEYNGRRPSRSSVMWTLGNEGFREGRPELLQNLVLSFRYKSQDSEPSTTNNSMHLRNSGSQPTLSLLHIQIMSYRTLKTLIACNLHDIHWHSSTLVLITMNESSSGKINEPPVLYPGLSSWEIGTVEASLRRFSGYNT